MATLYLRGSKWWARWYRPDGHRVQASTKTGKRRDAERIGAELEAADRRLQQQEPAHIAAYQKILADASTDAQAGLLTAQKAEEYLTRIRRIAEPDFKRITLRECLNEWLQDQIKRKVSESTAGGYRQMRDAVERALGRRMDSPLADFTHSEAGRLLHALSKGRTAATANLHFRAFRRALQSAVREKQIPFNPAEGVPPLPEDDSTEKAPFSQDEVTKLMAAADDEWRGLILVAVHTGLRLGDAVGLNKSHIEGASIVIRPRKTQRKRKTIFVPLSPTLAEWLKDKQGAFFPTLAKAKTGTLSTQFDRLRSKAGVPKFMRVAGAEQARTFHSLRHSFASWLAEAEIHPDVRQKLTGHQSAGIHARYTHHDEALKRAIDKLPAL